MKALFDIFKTEPDYARLLAAVQKGNLPAAASGLSNVHKAFAAAANSIRWDSSKPWSSA